MPDITITLTQAQVARLTEAWDEPGVPLRQSVLRALAKVTKDEIRRKRTDAAAEAYLAESQADSEAEDIEFDNW